MSAPAPIVFAAGTGRSSASVPMHVRMNGMIPSLAGFIKDALIWDKLVYLKYKAIAS